jgi:hypothetical protein
MQQEIRSGFANHVKPGIIILQSIVILTLFFALIAVSFQSVNAINVSPGEDPMLKEQGLNLLQETGSFSLYFIHNKVDDFMNND